MMSDASLRTFLPGILATLVPFFIAHTKLRAEDEGTPEQAGALETTVVTATGARLVPSKVPFTLDLIEDEKIEEDGYRTLPEVFRETPGVMVQKTSHGQGSPFIRGFTGFRNLLLIDGIRLNNSVFREGPNQYWNTVDPYSVRQIELVKGQGSVLFGSDAIGGTVNVLTKGPDWSAHAAGANYLDGRAFYRWSSAEQSHVGRIELSGGQADLMGYYIGYSNKAFGNLRVADLGEISHTGYDEWDLDSKLVYQLNPDARITLAYQQVQQNNVPRTHRTFYAESWEGSTVGSEQRRDLDQDRQLAYGHLEVDQPFADVDRALFSLSWHRQEEAQDRIRRIGDGRRDVQGITVDTLGAWAQFESATSLGEFAYGVSWYRDFVDSFIDNYTPGGVLASSGIQGPVGDDAIYDLGGLFVQDKISVGDDVDLWLGARGTYARADINELEDPITGAQSAIDEDWWDFSGSARLLWRPWGDESFQLYGGASQGYRAPNLSDLSRLDTARSNELETPSPGLDPEEFITFEVGTRVQLNNNLHAGITYFYTDIQDMIVRTPTGRIIDGNSEVIKKNAGDGYVQGIEAEASWEFQQGWTVFGNVTWQDGEVDTFPTSAPVEVTEPVSRLMPITALLGVRWEPNERCWVEVVGQFADEQDDLSTSDEGDTQRIPPGGTPDYAVVSLRGGWQVNDLLTMRMALENLTDEDYRIHGSGQNEAGFNAILAADMRF